MFPKMNHQFSTRKIAFLRVLCCFLLLIVCCNSTVSMPIPNYDLSLTPSILDPEKTGFIMTGNAATDYFGRSVASIGDINRDGYDDIIIGAPYKNSFQGAAYVIYGRSTLSMSDFIVGSTTLDPATLGFTITGKGSNDYLGVSVNYAGDVNGDKFDDLIVGAHGRNGYQGAVYVVYGGLTSSMSNLDFTSPSTVLDPSQTGFMLLGNLAGDGFGVSVRTAGDINGDGYDDIIIGAHGKNLFQGAVYVVYGAAKSSLSNIDFSSTPSLDPATTGFIIIGDTIGDNLGISVSTAGDMNGDGYDDIMIGAFGYNINQGRVYIIYGSKSFLIPTITLNSFSLSSAGIGFTITGITSGDQFGYTVSPAGDINGDGYDDIIIGAPNRNFNQGAAYVIYGAKTSSLTDIHLTPATLDPKKSGFTIIGDSANDYCGTEVNTAGDLNGDGYSDIIVGAYGNQGKAYIIYGGKTSSRSNIDLSSAPLDPTKTGFTVTGSVAGYEFGYSVNKAGDFNNDGYGDIIVGAPSTSSRGAAYLIHSTCILTTSGVCVERQFCQTCDEGASVTNPKCSSCPTNCQQYSSPTTCKICDQGYTLSNSRCKISSAAARATNVLQWISSILSLVGSAICIGSSIFLTPGLISKVVQYTRYIDLSVTDELAEVYKNWSTDVFSLGFPDSLSHVIQYKTLPSLFTRYDDIDAPFIANFWFSSMLLSGASCIYIFCVILKKLFAQGKSGGILNKLFAGSQNFLLVQAYGCLSDILFYLVLDAKTNQFNTHFSRASLFLAIACTCLGVFLIFWNFLIVKRYQRVKKNPKELEIFTEKNKYLELFYSDFSDADSWSHSFLAFLNIQSILSALIIAIFYQNRFVQTIFLAILDIAIIIFLLLKKPISGLQEKMAQYYFEILALMVHICTFILSVQRYEENASETMKKSLSKSIIYMNIALVVGGICFMLLELFQTIYEKIKEYNERQKQLQRENQRNVVHPISNENSDAQDFPLTSMQPINFTNESVIDTNRMPDWANNGLRVRQRENTHFMPSGGGSFRYPISRRFDSRMNNVNNSNRPGADPSGWTNQRDIIAVRHRTQITRNEEYQNQAPRYTSNLYYDDE